MTVVRVRSLIVAQRIRDLSMIILVLLYVPLTELEHIGIHLKR